MFPGSRFVVGANLPWVRYGCDFGANAWHPGGGVADGPMTLEVRRLFGRLASEGITIVRWFLFCDGRAGIRFDAGGEPLGLDDHVLPDLEAAIGLASEFGIGLILTLFDFSWCHPRTRVGGVDLGGHRRLFSVREARARLLERILVPVFQRAGRHPAIRAWDVINEPEWVTFGRGAWNPRASIRASRMRACIADVVQLAHDTTVQPVTVGLASAHWLGLVRDLGLDFHQVHWYDRLDWLARLDAPVARWGLPGPVLLGEFPTRGSARSPEEILALAQARGYAGALCWSARAADTASDYASAAPAIGRFAANLTAPSPAANDLTPTSGGRMLRS